MRTRHRHAISTDRGARSKRSIETPSVHDQHATSDAFGVDAGDSLGEQSVGQLLWLPMPKAPRTEGETSAASSIARAEMGAGY